MTDWPLSMIDDIPKAAHAPTAIFIAAGLLHLLVTIGTRFVKDDKPSRRARPAEAAPPAASSRR